MSKYLTPNAVFGDITDITVSWLKSNHIKLLALDLDNTLARYSEALPSREVVGWLEGVKDAGIPAVVVSNTRNVQRVADMCAALGIENFCHRAAKPSAKGFLSQANLFDVQPQQVCVIGDQIFTDVLGGNRAGCMTVLVNPRGIDESIWFRLRRLVETPFIVKAKKDMKV